MAENTGAMQVMWGVKYGGNQLSSWYAVSESGTILAHGMFHDHYMPDIPKLIQLQFPKADIKQVREEQVIDDKYLNQLERKVIDAFAETIRARYGYLGHQCDYVPMSESMNVKVLHQVYAGTVRRPDIGDVLCREYAQEMVVAVGYNSRDAYSVQLRILQSCGFDPLTFLWKLKPSQKGVRFA